MTDLHQVSGLTAPAGQAIRRGRAATVRRYTRSPVRLLTRMLALSILYGMSANSTGEQLNFDVMDLAPYGFTTARGEVRGIFVDMLKAIGREAGFDPTQRLYPIPRLTQRLRNRQCACSLFMRLPQLDRYYRFIAAIPWEINVVVVGEQHLKLTSLQDLRSLRVAVPRGMRFDNQLDDAEAFIRFYTNGYLQSTRMLKRGRVDAMAGTEPSLTYLMRQEGLIRPVTKLVVDTRLVSLYCIEGLDIYPALRGAVKSLAEKGTFSSIIHRYGTPQADTTPPEPATATPQ